MTQKDLLVANARVAEVKFLITGAGPAGASLACFLARYGLTGLSISAAPSTADTPRAHVTNVTTFDTLRDIGLWDECLAKGNKNDFIAHYRWNETMAGQEYTRTYSLSQDPKRIGDYEAASPCTTLDLPQTLMEPILVRYATTHGWRVRFDTKLLEVTEDKATGKFICLLQDRITDERYKIATTYLFGADGAKSVVAQQLGLPFTVHPGGGQSYNILVKADLAHITKHRPGLIYFFLRLEKDHPFVAVARAVKPWNEWVFIVQPKLPHAPNPQRSYEEWKEIVVDLIDDRSVEVEILRVSQYTINETAADVISKGNAFGLGDAIHRHPPNNGLGSNTAIQEAFNLAWKINLVSKGLAGPALLDTYNQERQPWGSDLVRITNESFRKDVALWQVLGVLPPGHSREERFAGIHELQQNSPAGKARRQALRDRMLDLQPGLHQLGREIGIRYSSTAVVSADETEPFEYTGKEAEDPVSHYESCTYPGRRVPHAWLSKIIPNRMVSTIDVAGKGNFCVFTGHGGDAWKPAAVGASKVLGIDITVASIGMGLDWEDPYFQWDARRGVEEDGAVLVRPDLVVAWRAQRCPDTEHECQQKLVCVLKTILHLQ